MIITLICLIPYHYPYQVAVALLKCPRPLPASPWALRDVVFQDVGFEHNSCKPITHISFRYEVPTPSVFEGQSTIIFKPHILKHQIPELPITSSVCVLSSGLDWDAFEYSCALWDSLSLSLSPSIHPSTHPPIHPSIHRSIHL